MTPATPAARQGMNERLPLAIGTKTKRGVVVGVQTEGGRFGERFYFLKCPGNVTALLPADIVEPLPPAAVAGGNGRE